MSCRRALKMPQWPLIEVLEVVMVGEITVCHFWCVSKSGNSLVARTPPRFDPDKVVAIGAAIQADILVE